MISARGWKASQICFMMVHKNASISEIVAYTGKSEASIFAMRRKLGHRGFPNWTKEEIEILEREGVKKASIIINKTEMACQKKKERLMNKK